MSVNFDLATQQRLRVGDTLSREAAYGSALLHGPSYQAGPEPGWGSAAPIPAPWRLPARLGVSGGAFPVFSPPGPSV